jgi:hypothetical protein
MDKERQQQQNDDLGQPGEIRQYDRTGGPDTIRGDELNPNKKSDVTPIYLTGDSTLQTPEEDEHDRSVDVTKNDTLAASRDDIHQPAISRMAGDSNQGTGNSDQVEEDEQE